MVKTNHLPTADIAAETGQANTYSDTFGTKVMGLVFHKSAVGTVKLQDLSTESEYQIQRQGTLMVAKYAMGHGGLRPECGVVLMNNDDSEELLIIMRGVLTGLLSFFVVIYY